MLLGIVALGGFIGFLSPFRAGTNPGLGFLPLLEVFLI